MSNCRAISLVILSLVVACTSAMIFSEIHQKSKLIATEQTDQRYCHATRMMMNAEVNSEVQGFPEAFNKQFSKKNPAQLSRYRPCPA